MDPTHALLVALMFITLLSIGLANIAAPLATLAARHARLDIHWIPVSWILLLLL